MNFSEKFARIDRQLSALCCAIKSALTKDDAILNQNAVVQTADYKISGNAGIGGKVVVGDAMSELVAGDIQMNTTTGILMSDATAGNYVHKIYPLNYGLRIEGSTSIRMANTAAGFFGIGTQSSWTEGFFLDNTGFSSTSVNAGVYAGISGGSLGFHSVGTSSPYKAFQSIYTSGTAQELVINSMTAGVATERIRLNSAGKLLVNTTTDNTIDTIQVNGSLLINGDSMLKFRNQNNYIIQGSGFFQVFSDNSTIRIRQDASLPVAVSLVGDASYFEVNNGSFSLLNVDRNSYRTAIKLLNITDPFTPTGSADVAGITGDIAKDDNYIYTKTSTGWKRAALSTF